MLLRLGKKITILKIPIVLQCFVGHLIYVYARSHGISFQWIQYRTRLHQPFVSHDTLMLAGELISYVTKYATLRPLSA